MRGSRISDRPVIGLLLVGLGVMFLLDTTDVLGPDTSVFGTYWPTLLIVWAVWDYIAGGFEVRLKPVIIGGIGAVFLLSNLDVWALDAGILWPVALVAAGLLVLFGGRKRRNVRRGSGRTSRPTPESVTVGETQDRSDTGSEVRASHIFGGGKERITSQAFQGGEISAVFGGMELDLREAGLSGGTAVVDANVVCGGIELRVPKDWRVNIQTTTLFGGAEDKRSQPSDSDAKGELTITGTILCGGIEVKD